jgi:hypothetical protein
MGPPSRFRARGMARDARARWRLGRALAEVDRGLGPNRGRGAECSKIQIGRRPRSDANFLGKGVVAGGWGMVPPGSTKVDHGISTDGPTWRAANVTNRAVRPNQWPNSRYRDEITEGSAAYWDLCCRSGALAPDAADDRRSSTRSSDYWPIGRRRGASARDRRRLGDIPTCGNKRYQAIEWPLK